MPPPPELETPPSAGTGRLEGVVPTAAGGLLAVTVAAWGGSLHWLLDLPSNFRWHLFVAAAVGLAWSLGRRGTAVRACLAAAVVGNGWALVPYWLPPPAVRPAAAAAPGTPPRRPLSLVTLNLHGRNRARERVTAYLRDRQADVVALLEVEDFWAGAIEDIADLYPYRTIHARRDFFGLALLCRTAPEDVQVVELGGTGLPTLVGRLRHAGRELRIVATHPRAPIRASYARDRDRQLRAIADLVAAAPVPCIVMGDLNATPFSAGFRDFVAGSGLRDSALGRGVQATWHAKLPLPGVPIDHVLVPPDAIVIERRVGPHVGSDHLPVEATIALP